MTAETFLDGRVTLHAGDMLTVLDMLPENGVDSVVCDPPYHLTSIVKRFGVSGAAACKPGTDGAYARASAGFMGKQWDGGDIAFRPETWAKVLRVLKPGGYILAFSSSRTFGEMAVALKAAGFITHPLIGRLFEQGGDIAAFLDSLSGEQLEAFCQIIDRNDPAAGLLAYIFGSGFPKAHRINACALNGPLARVDVEGFRYGGQATKPALEPIYLGQKPFSESTGTANVLRWGTGALNIDGCRVPTNGEDRAARYSGKPPGGGETVFAANRQTVAWEAPDGRWPANLIHDGSDEVIAAFPGDRPSGGGRDDQKRGTRPGGFGGVGAEKGSSIPCGPMYGDAGSASRFFYRAKADALDRLGSRHPTVKPLDLIQYLVRLVTPPGGLVLDCFAGTGTTGEAAFREGMRAVLIEREPEYQADIRRRMALCLAGPDERRRATAKAKAKPDDFAGTLFADPTPIAAE